MKDRQSARADLVKVLVHGPLAKTGQAVVYHFDSAEYLETERLTWTNTRGDNVGTGALFAVARSGCHRCRLLCIMVDDEVQHLCPHCFTLNHDERLVIFSPEAAVVPLTTVAVEQR